MAGGGDDHAPALASALAQVIDGAVRAAREARHRLRVDRRDRVVRLQRRVRPPGRAHLVAQLVEAQEAALQVDGGLAARGRGAPRGLQELLVRVVQARDAVADALGSEHDDARVGQVVGHRHESGQQRGRERLHALDRHALGDALEHLLDAGELGRELARASAHGIRQQHLAARREHDAVDRVGLRALVGDVEPPHLLDLVAEQLDAHRIVVGGREDVDDAAAHRELAAARDHVDARVGEVDEPPRQRREVDAARAGRELDGRHREQVVGDGLERRAHGCDHDRGRAGLPLGDRAERRAAPPDGLGRGAQALVRERLPRGQVEHLRLGEPREQVVADRLGLAPGRGDDEQRAVVGARDRRDDGGAHRLDAGERAASARLDDGGERAALEQLEEWPEAHSAPTGALVRTAAITAP
ncbi:hypothetical protein GCM10009640_24770 [Agrococcus citreus]|uniref:Uncharacterized protein n=1 Tax=Agrococcus citreus TaxID=84643 RepID=A0ABP4JQ17_9MICO